MQVKVKLRNRLILVVMLNNYIRGQMNMLVKWSLEIETRIFKEAVMVQKWSCRLMFQNRGCKTITQVLHSGNARSNRWLLMWLLRR